ncbi:UNVERIFIED_ORG: hypothetical protein GGD48_005223 [Rhizobium etli]
MSRKPIPLTVGDTSAFAKSLRLQLAAHEGLPSHLQFLNMMARAGHGKFQSLRAKTGSGSEKEPPTPARVADAAIDRKHIERVRRSFDEELRLMRWPSRRMDQITAL